MKTYFSILLALLVGAGIGSIWGYQQGLRKGYDIASPSIIQVYSGPSYSCPTDISLAACSDVFAFDITQEFGPV